MAEDFDLKKYLVENKLTVNSKNTTTEVKLKPNRMLPSGRKPGRKGKDFPIGDETCHTYRYDIDNLIDDAKEYLGQYDGGLIGYDEFEATDTGIDYQWAIAMGDDFPHAIIVKNPAILKDKVAMGFIRSLKESKSIYTEVKLKPNRMLRSGRKGPRYDPTNPFQVDAVERFEDLVDRYGAEIIGDVLENARMNFEDSGDFEDEDEIDDAYQDWLESASEREIEDAARWFLQDR